jgi:hypothetical protein
VRFIWEKLDHFLDHVERGRRRRLALEREARRAVERDRPQERTRVAALAPMPDSALADLEKLFGPGWRHSDAPQ